MIKKSKILIVDDEPRMCTSLKTLLHTQGYEIQTCCSGNEALNCLNGDEFDLVLLDVFMEGMNGFQILENIMNQQIDTSVIIMTGNASTQSVVKALRMGANDYLKKPFESEELFSSIKNALTQRILKKENESITKKLNTSEEKYRQIYNHILDVYFETSLDGIILEISPYIENLSQYKREELIGKSLYDIYTNPEDRNKLIEIITNKGIVRDYEVTLTDKDGTHHICSINIEVIKGDKTNPTRLVGIFRDITERKKAADKLRKSEEKYRSFFETSLVSLWEEDYSAVIEYMNALCDSGVKNMKSYFNEYPEEITKCAGLVKILDVNPATLKIFEAQNKEELLQNLNKVFTKDSLEVFKKQLISFFEGNMLFESDGINKTITGKKIYIHFMGSLISKDKVLVSITDITKRKQAEKGRERLLKIFQEALESIKTLRGLLPICSHCKKIRDDKGYWNQIEGYIQTHSEAQFSHGICPECSDELYGKEDWYIEMKTEKQQKE